MCSFDLQARIFHEDAEKGLLFYSRTGPPPLSQAFPWTGVPVSQADTAKSREIFLTVLQLQLYPRALGRELLCIHAYWERLMPASSHDGWPDDSNVQVSFLLLNQVFWQGFGVGVSVGPVPKQLGCDVLNDRFIQPPRGNKENVIICHRERGKTEAKKTSETGILSWNKGQASPSHLRQRRSDWFGFRTALWEKGYLCLQSASSYDVQLNFSYLCHLMVKQPLVCFILHCNL